MMRIITLLLYYTILTTGHCGSTVVIATTTSTTTTNHQNVQLHEHEVWDNNTVTTTTITSHEQEQQVQFKQQQIQNQEQVQNQNNQEHNQQEEGERITIQNMTCDYYEQPLNHFDLPNGQSGTYKQRYCYYNGFMKGYNHNNQNQNKNSDHQNDNEMDNMNDDYTNVTSLQYNHTILLYVGNESPIEQYINHTGFIWEYGKESSTQIIFIEHRYEGHSIPNPTIKNCMAYSSTIQALTDYVTFIEKKLFLIPMNNNNNHNTKTNTNTNYIIHRRPIIAIGGSYGGMLASWIRMIYPQYIVGAISASAPIGSFPLMTPTKIDTAYQVINHGLQQCYPPTVSTTTTKNNNNNMNNDITQYRTHSATTSTVTRAMRSSSSNSRSQKDEQPKPQPRTTTPITETNHCATNLLMSWSIIHVLGTTKEGRIYLQDIFQLCESLSTQQDVTTLIQWGQGIWFDLAESSYPYPSSYIPFALLHTNIPLPAWPLQAACWTYSQLHNYFYIDIIGNRSNVQYDIILQQRDDDNTNLYTKNETNFNNNNSMMIHVDWDNATVGNEDTISLFLQSSNVRDLLTNVREAVSIWYNITKDISCYNVSNVAPNNNNNNNQRGYVNGKYSKYHQRRFNRFYNFNNDKSNKILTTGRQHSQDTAQAIEVTNMGRFLSTNHQHHSPVPVNRNDKNDDNDNNKLNDVNQRIQMMMNKETKKNSTEMCMMMMQSGSWPALTCNEPMNIIVTAASGMGYDMFWPPTHPRGTKTYDDIIELEEQDDTNDSYCRDDDGYYGFPRTTTHDTHSIWYDILYGGTAGIQIAHRSNIIFSNGLLDPWCAAGVYANGMDPTIHFSNNNNNNTTRSRQQQQNDDDDPKSMYGDLIVPGLYIQKLNENGSVIALIMEYGGHHTDLMYSNVQYDPPSITEARNIEKQYIQTWVTEFWNEMK